MLHKLLCFLGAHCWTESRKLTCIDVFPPSFVPYENPTRICRVCNRKERWLPGYGGSEIGCWLRARDDTQAGGSQLKEST